MKAFAEAWPEPILQEPLAKLTWFHNLTLLEKVKIREERLWYAQAAIEHGWSRNILVMQIESALYRRQGKATTNFQATLPSPQSDLAHQLLKDPYNFDFLTLTKEAHERDLENGLLAHLRQFLVELGVLLDVFVAIFVISIMIHHINRTFSSTDTRRLSALKE